MKFYSVGQVYGFNLASCLKNNIHPALTNGFSKLHEYVICFIYVLIKCCIIFINVKLIDWRSVFYRLSMNENTDI